MTKLPTISLDFRFADERVVSAAYGSAATLLDYEVVIWNPSSLLHSYRDVGETTFQGQLRLSESMSFALPKDASRRTNEMQQLLRLGRTLVVFLPKPQTWYVFTGERNYSGTGRNRQTTNIVADHTTNELFPFSIELTPATGERMRLLGGDPFATFWRECKDLFSYHSYMASGIGATMVVIADTEYAVASIATVDKGTVILLPMMELDQAPGPDWELEADDDDHLNELRKLEHERSATEAAFLDKLFELVGTLRASDGDFSLPDWSAEVHLPEEQAKVAVLTNEQQRLGEQLAKIDREKQALAELQRRKLLFSATGTSLETLVEEAFHALDCEVDTGELGRTDRIIRRGDDVAVVEVKGKGKSAAESDAAQLEKWVIEHKLDTDEEAKGILVVNTWRSTPLDKRTKADFPDQMLPYSTSRGHCLITGLQLLGAWLDAERNPERRDAIFKSIRDCVGRYPNYTDWRAYLDMKPLAASESEAEN